MCPFCFATAAAIAAGVVSTSGVAALALLKRRPADVSSQQEQGAEKPPERSR